MPKLWDATVEEHRRAVRDATMDAAAALVAEHGVAALTMSQVAEVAGIGRATLYRYFPDVDAILLAWHQRQVARHLDDLARVRDQGLAAVLTAYALIQYEHHEGELAALLHRGAHVAHARAHLRDFLRDLVAEEAREGLVRDDVAPGELATYCLHAVSAASSLPSKAAVGRLVEVTLAGLRPPPLPRLGGGGRMPG